MSVGQGLGNRKQPRRHPFDVGVDGRRLFPERNGGNGGGDGGVGGDGGTIIDVANNPDEGTTGAESLVRESGTELLCGVTDDLASRADLNCDASADSRV